MEVIQVAIKFVAGCACCTQASGLSGIKNGLENTSKINMVVNF